VRKGLAKVSHYTGPAKARFDAGAMKPSETTALALVASYLMVSPKWDIHAPLYKWSVVGN
jgi:hypothetical protein